MPLFDHFRPPLSTNRRWEGFHSAWDNSIADQLNDGILPERYVADAFVTLRMLIEVDTATFEEHAANSMNGHDRGTTAVWAPPKPTLSAAIDYDELGVFEVRVFEDSGGNRLVAALELVSPGNIDRPSTRQAFAMKCASYLYSGVSLAVIDTVTDPHDNFHGAIVRLLGLTGQLDEVATTPRYAVSSRLVRCDGVARLESWAHELAIGAELPTLPLWIGADRSVPLDLEMSYLTACKRRRIAT